MFTIRRSPKPNDACSVMSLSRPAVRTLTLSTAIIMGLVTLIGCGQKGDLYLVEPSSQTVQESADVLDSTSHPQDAAFAGLGNDDQYNDNQNMDNFTLPKPSDDPNDY